ncbi:MAG: hypothetical protein RQ966_18245 [Acetobacteraceae bacterium]|jgi:hypothetical protein|nr:hypothetical protein [Acetobacteraceae bacterium]
MSSVCITQWGVTDLGIAASWLIGLLGARRAPRAQLTLGALTGLPSP